jgi:hypothetical protein
MYKKDIHPLKNYLQNRIDAFIPIATEHFLETDEGVFIFEHAKFPDLRVQGKTIHFVQESLERTLKKFLKNQSNKHIDYIFDLLLKQ